MQNRKSHSRGLVAKYTGVFSRCVRWGTQTPTLVMLVISAARYPGIPEHTLRSIPLILNRVYSLGCPDTNPGYIGHTRGKTPGYPSVYTRLNRVYSLGYADAKPGYVGDIRVDTWKLQCIYPTKQDIYSGVFRYHNWLCWSYPRVDTRVPKSTYPTKQGIYSGVSSHQT